MIVNYHFTDLKQEKTLYSSTFIRLNIKAPIAGYQLEVGAKFWIPNLHRTQILTVITDNLILIQHITQPNIIYVHPTYPFILMLIYKIVLHITNISIIYNSIFCRRQGVSWEKLYWRSQMRPPLHTTWNRYGAHWMCWRTVEWALALQNAHQGEGAAGDGVLKALSSMGAQLSRPSPSLGRTRGRETEPTIRKHITHWRQSESAICAVQIICSEVDQWKNSIL